MKKAIGSYTLYRSAIKWANEAFERVVCAGKAELKVYPTGRLIEKLRAASAGMAALYTPTGVGTMAERWKEKRVFNGREYLLELALKPDYAPVYACSAIGNQCHLDLC